MGRIIYRKLNNKLGRKPKKVKKCGGETKVENFGGFPEEEKKGCALKRKCNCRNKIINRKEYSTSFMLCGFWKGIWQSGVDTVNENFAEYRYTLEGLTSY